MDIWPHINSINVDALKKKLPQKLSDIKYTDGDPSLGICEQCMVKQASKMSSKNKKKKNKNKNNKQESADYLYDRLEICLTCMKLSCGRNSYYKHCEDHHDDK